MALFVSQAYLQSPSQTARTAQAAQTVGNFTQTATGAPATTADIQVAQVEFRLPDATTTFKDLAASQTVGDFSQTASLTELIGQINGGGVITENLPHRSAGATQTVGAFQTSAAGGGAGVLGPILGSALQPIGDFTQTALGDAPVIVQATQTVGDFSQDFRNYDLTRPRRGGGPGRHSRPTIRRHGKRYMAEVDGITIVADTLAELQRKVQQLVAQDAEKAQEAVKPARPPAKVIPVADPVQKAPEPIPVAEVERMVADFIQQQQALVDQYQAEVANLKLASVANTASLKASMMREVEQRVAQASSDMDAVVALMMDEPQPRSVESRQVQVMLPAPMPAKPKAEPKPDPAADAVQGVGKALGDIFAQLQAQITAPREVVRDENGKVTGVKIGDTVRSVKRDKSGRISGA